MAKTDTALSIDLNADLGETTGGNPVSDDSAMLNLVSSANVACGFHAGDPLAISRTVADAQANNVAVGAHVGYHDSQGFGRRFIDYTPAELAAETLYQIGALDALAQAHGTRVAYVKPHGALYNAIVYHESQAKAVIEGIKAFGRDLPVMLLPGAVATSHAEKAGLRVIHEVFADRAYNPDGTLVSRRERGAVLHDPQVVADRVVRMATEGVIEAIDGSTFQTQADSVCVHGDSPGAVAMAQAIADELRTHGVHIGSFL